MFVTFSQNNSGGYFIQDENVDVFVIIEGKDVESIRRNAEDIFDNYREYCECCGERWDDDYICPEDLTEEPLIYGEPVRNYTHWWSGCNAIIYFENGTKQIFEIGKDE